jgi:parallel beta-helix repeat protein
MTVQRITNYLIFCLAADTKPAVMSNNCLAYETDTGDIYKSSSGAWSLMTAGNIRNSITRPYTYFIYKSGSTYYAQSGDAVATPALTSNSDFKTLIQAIISGISPAGTPTRIVLGAGDFNLATQFLIPTTAVGNISIEGSGMGLTNIIITSAWNGTSIGNVAFKVGDFQTIAAGITGTLTANAAFRGLTATVSTTDAAKFAVGDYVLLTSTAQWSTAPSATSPQAEIKKLTAVNTGTGVITFDVPLFDTYNTANTAVMYKLSNMLSNIRVANLTIKKGSGLNTDTGNTTGVVFFKATCVDNFQMEKVQLIDNVTNYDSGLCLVSCVNSNVMDCNVIQTTGATYNLQYGISIGGCSQNVTLSNCRGIGRFRHPFEMANDQSGAGAQGIIRSATITHCTAEGAEVGAFDTHVGGEMITFVNCKVLGTTQSTGAVGFEIRAKKTNVVACSVLGANTIGIQLSGDAHDCVISGCVIRGCLSEGIRLINDMAGVDRTKIMGNSISECANNGIRFDLGCDYSQVLGNSINLSANNGMYLKDSEYLNVSNNTVTNSTNNGIWVDPATLTLSNNLITNNILSGNGTPMTFATSATGTWGTTNVVAQNIGYTGDADPSTAILTNKTLYADKNTFSGFFQDSLIKRVGYVYPVWSASGVSVLGGILTGSTLTATGVSTYTYDTTEGTVSNFLSTTTINQNIGVVSAANTNGTTRRSIVTRARMRSKVDTVAGSVSRLYFGFTSASALPISDTPLATTDHGIIVGFSSTDTTYQIYHNDGATSVTKDAVTGAIAKGTGFHTIEINWAASGNINVIFDGVTQVISTDLPATTTNLNFNAVVQNATAAARTHTVKGLWIETA